LDFNKNRFKNIYNDTSKVLFRLINRTNSVHQPYILTKQLTNYSSTPIGVYDNFAVYKKISNSEPYVYIEFLPNYIANQKGTIQGFAGNGQQLTFINCDGNTNSFMIFYKNLNPYDAVPNSNYNLINLWKQSAIAHPTGTFMPTEYFYYMKVGMGGCGANQVSNKWTDYYGVAFGLK
jgi:hypothetical protein